MDERLWVPGLVLAVLVLVLAEGALKTWVWREAYSWRACAASLGDALLRRALVYTGWSVTVPVLAWAQAHRLGDIHVHTAWQWGLLFLGQELGYYAYHRVAHRVRWFWATHAVHHSPDELTLANAVRLGATGRLTGSGLFMVPLVWVGFDPYQVFVCVSLNLAYQLWLHATWIPRLGPLEWVFNTPSHHRAHHGCQPRYLDCNFGGVLIVFDRLFGTFVPESDAEPPRYGLVHPLHSHNPLRIACHEWVNLAHDLWRAPTWRERMAIVVGPPEGPHGASGAAANTASSGVSRVAGL
jgi:sterol desaturase/sphingolipid hydroxylase (fatty acid hydroxylase superfamily)